MSADDEKCATGEAARFDVLTWAECESVRGGGERGDAAGARTRILIVVCVRVWA